MESTRNERAKRKVGRPTTRAYREQTRSTMTTGLVLSGGRFHSRAESRAMVGGRGASNARRSTTGSSGRNSASVVAEFASARDAKPRFDDDLVEAAFRGLTEHFPHRDGMPGRGQDRVVWVTRRLRDRGIRLAASQVEAWALAHGWAPWNATDLAQVAAGVMQGKPLRGAPNQFVENMLGIWLESLRRGNLPGEVPRPNAGGWLGEELDRAA